MRYLTTTLLALGLSGISAAASAQSATTVEQIGNRTSAVVAHDGLVNGTTVTQSGWDFDADVEIVGNSNNQGTDDNRITQTGQGSSATVNIVGDRNTFDIVQGGNASSSANNQATLDVLGNDNIAVIGQTNDFGETYANDAQIIQNLSLIHI